MNKTISTSHVVGYCTNVHAGEDLERYLSSLERYSLDVKARVSDGRPLAVGLWLSAQTARQMLAEDRVTEFRDFLEYNGLKAFTMNGFPFGNFHSQTVKYQVYKPDWSQEQRLNYTIDLIRILIELMPEDSDVGISTLPLAWPGGEFDYERAADNLLQVAEVLRIIELVTSKLIHLDIEPEPGCILSSSGDVVSFFKKYLLHGRNEDDILRYIRVCHDICHASVVFEDQKTAIKNYTDNGIRIGKVHVSSAIQADISADNFESVFEQLKTFQEDRYLHQTYIRRHGRVISYDDLPEAINDVNPGSTGKLRCHFHLPIFIEKFGSLGTTSHEIVDCLKNIRKISDCRHFEIETYAWTVLPDELRTDDLAGGIAKELLWMREQLAKLDGLDERNQESQI